MIGVSVLRRESTCSYIHVQAPNHVKHFVSHSTWNAHAFENQLLRS